MTGECKYSSEELDISVKEREEKTADVSDSNIFESQFMLSGREKKQRNILKAFLN